MTTREITTRLQASRAVARIGRVLQTALDRQARLDAAVARAKARFDGAKSKQSAFKVRSAATVEAIALPLHGYFVANRPADKQTLEVDTGRLGVVEGRLGKTEKIGSDEDIAAEILALDPEAHEAIVTTVTKVNLNVLKAHPELLAQMVTVHVPFVDTFVVDPDNTKVNFRRPVAWFTTRLAARAASEDQAALSA